MLMWLNVHFARVNRQPIEMPYNYNTFTDHNVEFVLSFVIH